MRELARLEWWGRVSGEGRRVYQGRREEHVYRRPGIKRNRAPSVEHKKGGGEAEVEAGEGRQRPGWEEDRVGHFSPALVPSPDWAKPPEAAVQTPNFPPREGRQACLLSAKPFRRRRQFTVPGVRDLTG